MGAARSAATSGGSDDQAGNYIRSSAGQGLWARRPASDSLFDRVETAEPAEQHVRLAAARYVLVQVYTQDFRPIMLATAVGSRRGPIDQGRMVEAAVAAPISAALGAELFVHA